MARLRHKSLLKYIGPNITVIEVKIIQASRLYSGRVLPCSSLTGQLLVAPLILVAPTVHPANLCISSIQASHCVCEQRSWGALGVVLSSVRYVSHRPDQGPLMLHI